MMFRRIQEFLKDKKNAKPIIFILTILSIIMIYRNREDEVLENRAEISVEVAKVEAKNMPIYISAIGTVTAENSANLISQVNGQLVKVIFQDGKKVKKGDLLAQIDSRPYEAQLLQYQGQLKKDQALLDNAKLDLARYRELWKQNSIAKQTLDTQLALVAQYEGVVQVDQGLLDNSKVNLEYCNIKAPFDGQMGIRLQNEGNLVQANTTNIGVINSYNPMAILFSVPEKDIAKIGSEFFKSGELEVEALDGKNQEVISKGKLIALDNQIDISTGTIKLKAIFDNSDNRLFPNQFVNVRVKVKELYQVSVIPESALQYNNDKVFVFLIEENKVKIRKIKVEAISDNLAIIDDSIKKDDLVAVSGSDKLIEDITVNTKLRE